MGTDLVNTMWHLCSSYITGLWSEALQRETQLQFFNMRLTTLSVKDYLSGSAADCVCFWASWCLSGSLPIKQGSLSSFVGLWEGPGEVGVDSLVWNMKKYVQLPVLCLTAIPSEDFLQKGSNGQVWINQEGSGICSTRGICLDGVLTSKDSSCPFFNLGFCETKTNSDKHIDAVPSGSLTVTMKQFVNGLPWKNGFSSCKLNPPQVIYHH